MTDVDSFESPFDSIRHLEDGLEIWYGRELMPLLGYIKWQDFHKTIQRGKTAVSNVGQDVEKHFMGVHKVFGTRGPSQQDYRLTRYACYMVAMNGDPSKPEIAAAQSYFAIKTREAELPPRKLTRVQLLERELQEARREEQIEQSLRRNQEEISRIRPERVFQELIGRLTPYELGGEVWYLAAEISPNIEVKEHYDLVYRTSEQNKQKVYITVSGVRALRWVVNANGLYEIVMGSRKTGGYLARSVVANDTLPSIDSLDEENEQFVQELRGEFQEITREIED